MGAVCAALLGRVAPLATHAVWGCPPPYRTVASRYFELSSSSNPRFPVFVCERTDLDWDTYCSTYIKPTVNVKGKLKRRHSIMFGGKIGKAVSCGTFLWAPRARGCAACARAIRVANPQSTPGPGAWLQGLAHGQPHGRHTP